MDDTLNLTDNKDAILKQIDGLHEKHRLNKLRELVEECHQKYHIGVYINYGDETLPESYICELWTYKYAIPAELTFGEPYDTEFSTWCPYCWHYEARHQDFLLLSGLFRYADQLPSFLIYSLHVGYILVPDHHKERGSFIWDKLSTLFGNRTLYNRVQLQRAIQHTPLSKLDIVYLTVLCESAWMFSKELSLYSFVNMMGDLSHQ